MVIRKLGTCARLLIFILFFFLNIYLYLLQVTESGGKQLEEETKSSSI